MYKLYNTFIYIYYDTHMHLVVGWRALYKNITLHTDAHNRPIIIKVLNKKF